MKAGVEKLRLIAEVRSASAGRALAAAKAHRDAAEAALAEAREARDVGLKEAAAARDDLRRARLGQAVDRAALERFLERLKRTRATEAEFTRAVEDAETALTKANAAYDTQRARFRTAHSTEQKRAKVAETHAERDDRKRLHREEMTDGTVPRGRAPGA